MPAVEYRARLLEGACPGAGSAGSVEFSMTEGSGISQSTAWRRKQRVKKIEEV